MADYQTHIESLIQQLEFPGPPKLREACLYALSTGGRRFRPQIVYQVAEALGTASVDEAALAVELFHTASLIADDLPCMDNESMRRGKTSLHRMFDEKTALLVTYALIAEAYAKLQQGSPKQLLPLVIEQASKNTGMGGATSGQFLDLDIKEHEEKIEHVLYLKTGSLFELSFVVGWLLGGGEVKALEKVRQTAYHFGLAFQISDDIDDYESDVGKRYNYARSQGLSKAHQRLDEELMCLKQYLVELGISKLYPLVHRS